MNNKFVLLWLLAIIVLFCGLYFPLLQGSDATEYASIATQMFYRNDWVNIINHDPVTGGVYDYLDKPHLLFWSAMIGYKLFGVTAFGYRFISVLMSLAAAFAVYKTGKLLYDAKTGNIAAIFFITAQAIILANHDVKTDTLLTAFVALAIWQLVAFVQTQKVANVIGAGAFLAGGVGTKGLIAVLVAGCAIFFYIAGKKYFKLLYNWKWLLGILSFFVFLSPILYCYYLQFDAHPEKFVNGGYGRSGVKFLLWSQSFDRFAGQRSLYPEFGFFFHTFLWAFLPWSLMTYYGTFYRLKELLITKGRSFFLREQLTFTGTWIMFLIMSLSKFKLPHYLNVLFPLFSIFTAGFIVNLWHENKLRVLRGLAKMQWVIVVLALIALVVLNAWSFPIDEWWIAAGAIAGTVYVITLLWKRKSLVTAIWYPSAVAILVLNFVLNTSFYPKTQAYQAGSSVAIEMEKKGIDPKQVYNYEFIYHPFDFYSKHWQPLLNDSQIQEKLDRGEEVMVYADEYRKKHLQQTFETEVLITTPDFGIAGLTGKFLNPNTRSTTYDNAYLLKLK